MVLSKQGQGAPPPGPPLRAQPLEPLRFQEGARLRWRNARGGERLPETLLMDSKGSAFGGGPGGSAPWPYFLSASPKDPLLLLAWFMYGGVP